MATASEIGEIIKLYVGYYNRAPDPVGLNFWIDAFDNGFDLDAMADDFSTQPETLANYPFFENENPSDEDYGSFVDSVYQNLFNRNPDEAGKAFWVEKLGSGEFSVGQAISLIIEGATTSPDQDVVANKVAAGRDFYDDTNALPTYEFDEDDIAAATAIQAGVTENPATVVAAAAQTDAYVAVISADDARTITLTQNTDAPGGTPMGTNTQGGTGDDSYSGTVEQGGNGTLQNGDTIAAAGGDDTLDIRLVGGANLFLSDVVTLNATDLENINVTNQVFGGSQFILDMQATSGEQALTSFGGDVNTTLVFDNVDEGTAIRMVDALGNVGVGFNGDRENSTDDAFSLTVEDSGTEERTASFYLSDDGLSGRDESFEIANLHVTGTQASHLTLAHSGPTHINVTGDQKLHLQGLEGDFDELVSVDASGMSAGGLELVAQDVEANDFAFVGSVGDDGLQLSDGLLAGSSSLQLSGGAGIDTLTVETLNSDIDGAVNRATGFEQLESKGHTSQLDASAFDDIHTFILNQSDSGTANFTGVEDEDRFIFVDDAIGTNDTLFFEAESVGQSLTFELRSSAEDNGSVSILALGSNGGAAVGFSEDAQFSDVTIHSTGEGDDANLIRAIDSGNGNGNGNHYAFDNDDGPTNFLITGNQDLMITAMEGVSLTSSDKESGFRETVNLDGSGSTGDLRVAGSNLNDRIEGGSGDDIIYGMGGDDVMVGNSGADQFRFSDWDSTDEIIDFTNGEDVVGLQRIDFDNTSQSTNGRTLNTEDYVENIQSISQISSAEDLKIVELQTAQSQTQIEETTTQSEVEAYVMVFNSSSEKAELWYDGDWATDANREHVATFDNVDTLVDLVGFSNTDFVEYVF